MDRNLRDTPLRDPKLKKCPSCNERGTIVFWGLGPKQMDLTGKVTRSSVKLDGSRCSVCRATFPPGHLFEEV